MSAPEATNIFQLDAIQSLILALGDLVYVEQKLFLLTITYNGIHNSIVFLYIIQSCFCIKHKVLETEI
jgi:hypothetical protein